MGSTTERDAAELETLVAELHAENLRLRAELETVRTAERDRAATIVRGWLAPPGAELTEGGRWLINRIKGE